MERSQRIRQASVRQITGTNLTLSGLTIEANDQGGDIVMFGSNVNLCSVCGSEVAPGIPCH